MPIEIDLIRHGETEANAAEIWQGQGDTSLTERGAGQARRLGERLAATGYDVLVSSDLGRARATAAAIRADHDDVDPAWREADVGSWEGLGNREVAARFPDELARLAAGEEIAFGGGETYRQLADRAFEAFDKLAVRLADGQRAAVVTHGGVVGAIVAGVLGLDRNERRRVLGRIANTSITRVRIDGDARRLAVLNDASHLGPPAVPHLVTIIRHGETEANLAGRWQGSTDGALTANGHRQAADLAPHLAGLAAVYSSPLQRARATAVAIAGHHGVPHDEHPGAAELRFGEWEDRARDDIAAGWPDEWRRIYVDGEDLPRGRTGETFAAAGRRLAGAIAELAARHPNGDGWGVVSHGGAIRAYVSGLLGLPFAAGRSRLDLPRNTGLSRVQLDGATNRLVDYNVAPHLDG